MSIVYDASACVAWKIMRADPDERRQAAEWLERFANQPALAPALFPFEVLNALLSAERQKAITGIETTELLALVGKLAFIFAPRPDAAAWARIADLARRTALTAYDASYLDLAITTGSALATFDKKLATARDRLSVPAP